MTRFTHSTPRAPRRKSSAAFTLLEVMVAVAAVALLAVGISQVFRATGATLKGGRRLSYFNQYAAAIERQLRQDIDSMTRDGFMVIRHEEVRGGYNPGDPVELYPGQPLARQRTRRADQLAFFAKGDFSTVRDAVHPSRIARSNVARIYYGHGLPREPKDPQQEWAEPIAIDDDNTIPTQHAPWALGIKAAAGVTPYYNQYASNWILLRHVTLLAHANDPSRQDIPPAALRPPNLINTAVWADCPIQVSLQPAAPSIFSWLNSSARFPSAVTPDNQLVRNGATDIKVPRFGSGVVDIANTDLAEIRAAVLGLGNPTGVSSYPLFSGAMAQMVSQFPVEPGGTPSAPISGAMQAWMRLALPVDGDIGGSQAANANPSASLDRGGRMRCEPTPPNYLGLGPGWPAAAEDYRRTDQVTLSAFNFVPGCSEFIVEWSFGETANVLVAPGVTAPEVIWHGRDRFEDVNGNNIWDSASGERLYADPYGGAVTVPVPLKNGNVFQHPVRPGLIHGYANTPVPNPPPPVLYSYFGYIDPTFNPAAQNARESTVPWLWPKLMRITMSLVDPNDPTYEQTYQFVFKVPQRDTGVSY
ncbi:MAG: prepilin-type N-terminal cleavage/methylation domain-containing protein [Phycisphaeraceae bacterium]|nr:prepilin-type N-terminal cleavage/methylation domain-containing protein [Phycisphaeraceae bacterium]